MLELMEETDPVVLLREMAHPVADKRRGSRQPGKRDDCGGDEQVWKLWKALHGGGKHRAGGDEPKPLLNC